MGKPLVLVHGGAGLYSDDRVEPARLGCERAAKAGADVLRGGGSAVDAVCEAVRVLEDDPEFNAGTGSCLTETGDVEMDACVMDGRDLKAGALGAIQGIRNPILAARLVMERSRHVFLVGDGARHFVLANGVAPYPTASLITPRALEKWKAGTVEGKHGTVGAVAVDAQGHVAAATSTGGILRKLPGRIGDSPIVGAGTFADDARAAASATGTGEPILRLGLTRTAADLSQRMSAQEAVDEALVELRERTGGEAGLILVNARGELGISRTTKRMSWAHLDIDGRGDARCE
ncbi:MAG: isoaspartyl peptidase/L-asparaginase [Deltaproteobacteria bacterium]|nr:isoaspartyl peptidase/L-asparaginase [Deltaproteobacteria bacterium]